MTDTGTATARLEGGEDLTRVYLHALAPSGGGEIPSGKGEYSRAFGLVTTQPLPVDELPPVQLFNGRNKRNQTDLQVRVAAPVSQHGASGVCDYFLASTWGF